MTSLYRSVILLLSVATIQVQAIKWDVDGIKGGYQQQQPELQQTTLHADSTSAGPKLLRPTCMTQEESTPYLLIQENDEHFQFFKKEDIYFESEYRSVRKLGQGSFGTVHLAIKKSNELKVVYKTIGKENVKLYTLESSPPPVCHSTEFSTLYGKHVSARCMPSRPQNLLLPFEVKVQEYLSQSGYENPHVPSVIDYIVTEKAYILVMEYSGEEWVDLDRYIKKYGKFSVDKARLIIKEVVTALVSFKKFGILHRDVAGRNILYNDRTGGVKLIDFGVSEPLEGCNQDSSAQAKYSSTASRSLGRNPNAGRIEIRDIQNVGYLLYILLTWGDPDKDIDIPQKEFAKELRNSLNNPESQLAINAANLVASLFGYDLPSITTIEAILGHPFFTSQ
ncbi:hypothetical protein BASA60_000111 [Batrachochytrium salamandrivorans]|nr:hypothetical protein BASA60_000111 [Batrachochytrium salamandrivorans]